ncbi:hypothetical protein B0H17DRAFT_1210758 [Mycena rosella]|uniref:Uncharacterized protein n=1 Tax=Mycena rosella TaxID=1033263 RepID=A0AAD7CW66_MYCRO|nr:hypothetical protein B0H17DRAFT_1210758 [Mycena rosella]
MVRIGFGHRRTSSDEGLAVMAVASQIGRTVSRPDVPFKEGSPPAFVSDPTVRIKDLVHIRPPTFGSGYLREENKPTRGAAFVATTAAALSEGRIHARKIRELETKAAEKEAAENEVILVAREAAIRKKLYSLGWGDQLAALRDGELSRLKVVNKVRPLTDDL